MVSRLKMIFLVMLCFIFLGGLAVAEEVDIHGFVSQGYIKTTNNNYLIDNSKDGSFQFNEVGINFSTSVNDELRGGLQLFSRDLGSVGKNDIKLDWAVIDYSWKEVLGLRAGKIKNPIGFYNAGRDVDLLRGPVFLPQAIYQESIREIFVSTAGISIYGTLPLAAIGSLEYEGIIGSAEVDDNNPYFRDVLATVGVTAENLQSNVETAYITAVRWNTPLDGLRFGFSGFKGNVSTDFSIPALGVSTTLDFKAHNYYVVSAEYIWNNLTLSAEFMRTKVEFGLPSAPNVFRNIESKYIQGSYRFFDKLELGAYYSEEYPNRNDKDGKLYALAGFPDYVAWQKEIVVFARYDINDNWLVKFEIHDIDGTALLYQSNNPNGFKKDWTMYAAKTTFSF